MFRNIHHFDSTVGDFVRRLPPSFDSFFLFFTAIGDPIATIIIAVGIAFVGVFYHLPRIALSALAIPATLIIGSVIKLLVHRMRPVSEFSHTLRIDTYSFPSGHSSGSMVAYGLLAYLLFKSLPAPFNYAGAIIVGLLPIVIGVSRIYLGVHYPSDVIGGWLLGAGVLIITIILLRPLV